MKRDWLWDRKVSLKDAKKILKNKNHKDFIFLASLLLSRKNEPKEVFKEYIEPIVFCKFWSKIKKNMRKDKWANQRIIFWQAIYEKLREKYKEQGIKIKEKSKIVSSELCLRVGEQIKNIRKDQSLSQKALAKKLGVSQQLVSRIEKGRENVSLNVLNDIIRVLKKKINIDFI